MSRERPFLSVIVPVRNGARVLPQTLAALAASDLPRDFWELIVIDDASNDQTVEIGAGYADTLIRLGLHAHGPSYARNRGAEVANGEVLVFIDADVCVHPDTLRAFAWTFLDEPDVAAVFGSYDDAPAAPGIVSQYRNLLHHYVHHANRGEAETFWAGCGAIRRQAFLEVGMYNEWHFSRPQVEDIELGHRLRDHGHRIVIRPEIQGKHLKRWTLWGVLTTDLKDRGVPWTRLLIHRGETNESRTLNLKTKERICTVLVYLALLAILIGAPFHHPAWLAVAGVLLGLVMVANLPLYAFFGRTRGLFFALAVLPLHLTQYIINGLSVVVAYGLQLLIGEPTPPAAIQAFAERGVVKWPPVPKPAELGGSPERARRRV